MKIVRIEATHYMGLRHVVIEPGNRHAVLIGGYNEQGKSSLIGAIAGCISGREVADEPIHHGQKRAEIRMDTEDPEWEVVRKFTTKGSTLQIRNAEGKIQKSPQKLLNDIIGKRCLDPLAFMRLRARDQRDALVSMIDIGINLTLHSAERKKLYDERSGYNSDVKRLRFEVEAKEDPAPIADEIDMSVVTDELRKLREVVATQADDIHKHSTIVERIALEKNRNAKRRIELASLQSLIADYDADVAAWEKKLHAAELDLGTHTSDEDIARQVAEAEDAISTAATTNAEIAVAIAARKAFAGLSGELKTAEKETRRCTRAIDRLDDEKARALSAATMPVAGLGFDDERVLWKDVPLSQASSSRRIRVSLALAAAMSPKLRDIWTTEAALIDVRNLEVVKEFAEENDLRFWLERVGEDDEGAIIIRDGEIVDVPEVST